MISIKDKALQVAVDAGDVKALHFLLEEGADASLLENGTTALHKAVLLGRLPILECLLRHGVSANITDEKGCSPLHWACLHGQLAMCNRLLKAGASVQIINQEGDCPLHLAAASGHTKIVRTLLQNGADLYHKNIAGNTAIALACAHAQLNLIKAIEIPKDLFLKDNKQGNTPLLLALMGMHKTQLNNWAYVDKQSSVTTQYCIQKGQFFVQRPYQSWNKEKGSPLSWKSQQLFHKMSWFPKQHQLYYRYLQLTHYLIKQSPHCNTVNNKHLTPLRLACIIGDGTVIKALHQGGAALNLLDKNVCALHLVASSTRTDALKALLRCFPTIDLHQKDNNGWTVLHYLADADADINFLNVLLKKGIDKGVVSTHASQQFPAGITAAAIALARNNLDLAIALDP